MNKSLFFETSIQEAIAFTPSVNAMAELEFFSKGAQKKNLLAKRIHFTKMALETN